MERLNKTIIDHNHEAYRKRWENARLNKYNGAFYYSKEIKEPESYITDKEFNIKKDDLSIYNEKFFQEKEIDKKRKKNEAEKLGKEAGK